MYKHTYFNPQYKTTQSNTQTLKTENSHSKHTHTIHVIPSAFPSMKKLSTRIISLSRARYHKCFMYFFSCTRTLVYIFYFTTSVITREELSIRTLRASKRGLRPRSAAVKRAVVISLKGRRNFRALFFFSSVLYYFRLGKGFRAN